VRLKASPEDFRVDELAEWAEDPKGPFAIYKVRKRKLTTFEAMRLIAARGNVPLDRLSYIGLKDRQGVTTQFVSLEGGALRGKIGGIHYELVGHAREKLTAENLRGNEFSIVVRDLGPEDVRDLGLRVTAVAKHGLPHYFDDQRFGSLAAGQGFPAKELVKGDPEGALKLLLATPGARDPIPEKNWKILVRKTWGDWGMLARKWGTRPFVSVVRHLKRKPEDFIGAWSHMPGKERAIHVFAYQSFIWNDALARYLWQTIPAAKRFEAPSVAGRLVFWSYGAGEEMPALPTTFPLIDHATPIADPRIAASVDAALKAEGLTRESFAIKGVTGAFFKHEERPLVLRPERLVVSRPPSPDEKNHGRLAVGLSFRLPPGGYATLVVKRLFPGLRDGGPRRPQPGRPEPHRRGPEPPRRGPDSRRRGPEPGRGRPDPRRRRPETGRK
jgi:tRNA pseudouridine13 synthase